MRFKIETGKIWVFKLAFTYSRFFKLYFTKEGRSQDQESRAKFSSQVSIILILALKNLDRLDQVSGVWIEILQGA